MLANFRVDCGRVVVFEGFCGWVLEVDAGAKSCWGVSEVVDCEMREAVRATKFMDMRHSMDIPDLIVSLRVHSIDRSESFSAEGFMSCYLTTFLYVIRKHVNKSS